MDNSLLNRRQALALGLAAAGTGTVGSAFAQQAAVDTSKPLRIILTSSAGGVMDATARAVADSLQQAQGRPTVVDPRPGASGLIGAEATLKLPADGNTVCVIANQFVVMPLLRDKMPYDVKKDFAPVVLLSSQPFVLVTRADRPYKTLPELVAYAKANPGKVNYATAGAATIGHLITEWLKVEAGINLVNVQYGSQAQANTDLLGGHVDIMFSVIGPMLQHIRAGTMRAMAVTGAQRVPTLSDVPTVVETGYPNLVGKGWFGLVAAAGTPPAAIQRINQDCNRMLEKPEVRKAFAEMGLDTDGGSAQEFAAMMDRERATWDKVIKAANIPKQ